MAVLFFFCNRGGRSLLQDISNKNIDGHWKHFGKRLIATISFDWVAIFVRVCFNECFQISVWNCFDKQRRPLPNTVLRVFTIFTHTRNLQLDVSLCPTASSIHKSILHHVNLVLVINVVERPEQKPLIRAFFGFMHLIAVGNVMQKIFKTNANRRKKTQTGANSKNVTKWWCCLGQTLKKRNYLNFGKQNTSCKKNLTLEATGMYRKLFGPTVRKGCRHVFARSAAMIFLHYKNV